MYKNNCAMTIAKKYNSFLEGKVESIDDYNSKKLDLEKALKIIGKIPQEDFLSGAAIENINDIPINIKIISLDGIEFSLEDISR